MATQRPLESPRSHEALKGQEGVSGKGGRRARRGEGATLILTVSRTKEGGTPSLAAKVAFGSARMLSKVGDGQNMLEMRQTPRFREGEG